MKDTLILIAELFQINIMYILNNIIMRFYMANKDRTNPKLLYCALLICKSTLATGF